MNTTEFDSALDERLRTRNGPAVAGLLLCDPLNRFSHGFNQYMAPEIGPESIEFAYLNPLAVVAVKVEQGLIPDAESLFKMLYGIQKRTALKLTTLAVRRANPRVRVRRRRGDAAEPQDGRALFVRGGGNLDSLPGRASGPSDRLERREMFPVLLAAAQEMGRLPVRVFREVREFGHRNGTTFGAFKAVAQQAELDETGHVVAIRRYDPDRVSPHAPSARTVRQIRRIYHAAVKYLKMCRKKLSDE